MGQTVLGHKSACRFLIVLPAWLLAVPHTLASAHDTLPARLAQAESAPASTAAATCPPAEIHTTPLPAGLMRLTIASPCRKSQSLRIIYAGIELLRPLDAAGELTADLDCIAGDDFPVDVLFEDGSRNSMKVTALDLARVTKVAVLWRAPVNLDLHAFEYAARPGAPGHVWAGAPSSPAAAETQTKQTGRGRGFMSTISTGEENGSKLEVYTFWRSAEQKSGVVSMALDYESRARQPQDPDTCGTGLYSEVRYETILFDRNASIKRQFGSLAAIDCNVQLSGLARYNNKTIPEITAKP